MTPLAAHYAKQLTLPLKRREMWLQTPQSIKRLREDLDDIHCFEVSRVGVLIPELSAKGEGLMPVFETLEFLPAPNTWIESNAGRRRMALLLRSYEGKARHYLTFYIEGGIPIHIGWTALRAEKGDDAKLPPGRFTLDLPTSVPIERAFPSSLIRLARKNYPDITNDHVSCATYLNNMVALYLVCINSPHIVGRTTHAPNRALERRLLRNFGPGKFPLRAWTEIELKVNKPIEIDDGEPHEAHLTGRRALHFVRKFIRIRLGRLEYVSAHWRGDPALGIVQSRYIVTP